MSLNDENRNALVDLYMEKSSQTLDDMECAIQNSKWNMAANRMYYSLFHALSALLVKDGYSIKSHKGVKSALGFYYVQTGKISIEDAKVFAQLASLREKADYNVVFQTSEDDVVFLRPSARQLLDKIKSIITE